MADVPKNGLVHLPEGVVLQIMPRYVGQGETGRIVDERPTLVVVDRDQAFWPLIVRMDPQTARQLRDGLRQAMKE